MQKCLYYTFNILLFLNNNNDTEIGHLQTRYSFSCGTPLLLTPQFFIHIHVMIHSLNSEKGATGKKKSDWSFVLQFHYFLHTILKVKLLSKNSILTRTQHFHEFFTQKNRQFSREIKVEFLDKKWRFRTVCQIEDNLGLSEIHWKGEKNLGLPSNRWKTGLYCFFLPVFM